ncbi:MAG: nuclear transport factor 2 family protein [Saprospiraceae bacterium]|nr:nuclear transport factor 2 family protein [Saprospiraceae bacterium]MDZ4704193.1 nuclear transport factor 2 family protein [Saprospiraceae bacterium]
MQNRIFFLLLIGLLGLQTGHAQKENAAIIAIRNVMQAQETAWNKGDLEGFMEGYLHSDNLCFIGSKGLTYGWDATLANYKQGYPDRATMGMLTFTLIRVEKLSGKAAFVIGKWHLKRDAGDLSGHFTLLWKKIKGKWLIVADHSS